MQTAPRSWLRPAGWLLLVTALCPPRVHAQALTQTLTLQPGWNAVWLEVEPPDRAPSAVFAGLPLASVWTWSERVSATDFIQNPDTAGWNRAQWLAFFPTNSPEARLANLHAVLPQRAYLVRLAGTNAVTWSVTGRPVLTTPDWVPDRFNLRGFPVDDTVAPTFRQFFRASGAHFEPGSGRLAEIFRLGPDGRWNAVAPDDVMRRGEACWVYTRGASEFVAPFSLEVNSGEGVDFNGVLRRVEITLRNVHAAAKSIRIESAGPLAPALLLLPPLPGQTNGVRPLGTHHQPVAAGRAHRLRLGLDRSQLGGAPAARRAAVAVIAPGDAAASLLRVSDGEGTLYHVGVNAAAGAAADFTGLWVGTVTVTNVSPTLGATSGPGTPGPVAAGFPLRLLLHVDDGGQVSLLRDVTLVYVRTNPPAGTNPPAYLPPRATALVTDPARLVGYAAADVRSGAVRGRRLTAPHFEFARTNGQFTLPLTGVFAPSNVVTGTLAMPGDLPTNPFLHLYHPDHGANAYAVTRDITFRLDAGPAPDPGEGGEVLGGTYAETITGLHRLPLSTSGSLELRRLSDLGVLNAGTTP
ncbi:MAG: hypothetical protein ACKVYV_08080 [Limisphaerales bacterium]